MIRVVLPSHLRQLVKVSGEVTVEVNPPLTQGALVDALELQFPVLRGTIRDQSTHQRRSYIRYFACGADLSQQPPETLLPEAVINGQERFIVVGAMAGG